MKKFISIVLFLVLVFSFSIPSFATELEPPAPDYNTELDALNGISSKLDTLNSNVLDIYLRMIDTLGLYLRNIKEDISNSIVPNLSNSLAQLLDINDFTRSSYDEIKKIRENLFGDTLYLQSFAEFLSSTLSTISTNVNNLKVRDQFLWTSGDIANTIDWDNYKTSWYYMVYDDLNMLQEVLADEDDLAMKESQKANQESAFASFFSNDGTLNTSTSLSPDSFTSLSNGFKSFRDLFGVQQSSGTSISEGFSYISAILSGEDPSGVKSPLAWLTDETFVDIDRVSSSYSLRSSRPVIVTNYYSSQLELFDSLPLGGE